MRWGSESRSWCEGAIERHSTEQLGNWGFAFGSNGQERELKRYEQRSMEENSRVLD